MTIQRNERVSEEIRRHLADLIRDELRDPRIGFVTITEVKLSVDLRNATVFVTVLPAEQRESSLHGLKQAVPFLRRTLARKAGLRFTPRLHFCHDEAFEQGQRIDEFLRTIHPEEGGPGEDEDR